MKNPLDEKHPGDFLHYIRLILNENIANWNKNSTQRLLKHF